MRLTDNDRKDPAKVKKELLKEFEHGKRNREEALNELSKRKRQQGESAQNYAYKLMKLVKLAYPTFENKTQETIAKVYFFSRLRVDMQIALKSIDKFEESDLNIIADETTGLELAGIKSVTAGNFFKVDPAINEETMVDSIGAKVIEKLQAASISTDGGQPSDYNEEIKFAGANFNCGWGFGVQRNFGRGRGSFSRKNSAPRAAKSQGNLRCGACQSNEHLYRFCPMRFCQAYSKCGHDAWDPTCSNYQ